MSKVKKPLIYLIAGEVSGDLLGRRLMEALTDLTGGNVEFAGVGGPEMEAAGLTSLFEMSELSVMGLAEVLPKIPALLKRINQTAIDIDQKSPDLVLTIDAPDFSFRVHKKIKVKTKQTHLVAPSVWAWRPGRAKKVATFLDHLYTLFPFEPQYFVREGLASDFVGHSMIEKGIDKVDISAFHRVYNLSDTDQLLTILVGSRLGEARSLLPIYHGVVSNLAKNFPDLKILMPVVPKLKEMVAETVKSWALPVTLIEGEQEKYQAFKASTCALAASGTVTLELALAQLPTIITYKANPISAGIFKWLTSLRYVGLPNIIADREVMPEYLQAACNEEQLSAAVTGLLLDDKARLEQKNSLAEIAKSLQYKDEKPSYRQAKLMLDLIQ